MYLYLFICICVFVFVSGSKVYDSSAVCSASAGGQRLKQKKGEEKLSVGSSPGKEGTASQYQRSYLASGPRQGSLPYLAA